MYSICGIFNANRDPVNRTLLNKMLDALKISCSDLPDYWHNDFVALGKAGHNYSFSEADREKSVFHNETGCSVVAISRIYNKKELFDKLSIPQYQQSTISDSQIFLECFNKWEYECPNYILGEWIFALWNSIEQELFLANSHFCNPGLYYYKSSHNFIFSNSLKALLATAEIPKEINDFRMGQLLISNNFCLGETVYKGIYYLEPAHALRISFNKFEKKRYWLLEDTPPTRFKTDDEYVDAFKELYKEAVRCRVAAGENIGSTLSGGLDSGSVTSLAAMELKKHGKMLLSFSSVPLFDVSNYPAKNRFGDETEFINATANHAGNVDVNFVNSRNLSPLQGIKKLVQMFEEPLAVTKTIYWLISIMESAQSRDIDTLLIGQWGNTTVSWKGAFPGVIDWLTFMKNVKARGVSNLRGLLETVNSQLIIPIIPVQYKQMKKRQQVIRSWNEYTPINREYAKGENFAERIIEEVNLAVVSRDPRDVQISMIKPRYEGSSTWFELGRQYNMWVSDPTADKRILEFCTSIPNDQFYRNGTEKYLFKRAMKGILPDKVLYNTKRGQQSADMLERIKQDLPEIKNIIDSLKKSPICNHYLDVQKIEAALPFIERNSLLSHQQISRVLLRGIMFGLFLQRFE
jgi:asparagine synthase (glutamine-hydrolysing)